MNSPVVIIGDPVSLSAILRPLGNELHDHSWLICSQSGPFRDDPRSAAPSLDDIFDLGFIDTEACRNTSASCWRAGTFPALSDRLVVDEWTYLFALPGGEADVARRAAWIAPRLGRFDGHFFAALPEYADLFAVYVDGWWEVYTPIPLRSLLLAAFPGSLERSADRVGEPP